MRSAACFGDILDEKVAAASRASTGRAARPSVPPVFARTPTGFPLGAWPPFGVNDIARGTACSAYSVGQAPTSRATAPRPPARPLSPAQRVALECLRGFGAPPLDEACTDGEIKAAFRELARRFHPDRHPDADEAERQYLAHAFGRIAEAYRVLGRI